MLGGGRGSWAYESGGRIGRDNRWTSLRRQAALDLGARSRRARPWPGGHVPPSVRSTGTMRRAIDGSVPGDPLSVEDRRPRTFPAPTEGQTRPEPGQSCRTRARSDPLMQRQEGSPVTLLSRGQNDDGRISRRRKRCRWPRRARPMSPRLRSPWAVIVQPGTAWRASADSAADRRHGSARPRGSSRRAMPPHRHFTRKVRAARDERREDWPEKPRGAAVPAGRRTRHPRVRWAQLPSARAQAATSAVPGSVVREKGPINSSKARREAILALFTLSRRDSPASSPPANLCWPDVDAAASTEPTTGASEQEPATAFDTPARPVLPRWAVLSMVMREDDAGSRRTGMRCEVADLAAAGRSRRVSGSALPHRCAASAPRGASR